jgi:hypothetical protein
MMRWEAYSYQLTAFSRKTVHFWFSFLENHELDQGRRISRKNKKWCRNGAVRKLTADRLQRTGRGLVQISKSEF